VDRRQRQMCIRDSPKTPYQNFEFARFIGIYEFIAKQNTYSSAELERPIQCRL
jgi:hypothetical protein